MIPWGKRVNIPKIAEELRAVGITGRMNEEGYLAHPHGRDLTPQERQALQAVVAAHDPTPPPDKWKQHHDRIDTYGLPEVKALLRELLRERLPPQE